MLVAGMALVTSVAPALAQERLVHELGEFEFSSSSAAILITAPHGTYDANTALLATRIARRLGAGYVAARQFTADRTRINVNRPTEGAGLACAQERHTVRAQEVYDLYTRLLRTVAAGRPLRLYVEIHGNSNPRSARQIEIATSGISPSEVQSVKEDYPAVLARTRERLPAYPELTLLVEPLDRMFFTASCAKSVGILSTDFAPRAIHFELPRSTRERESLEATAALVADIVGGFLRELPDRSGR